MKKVEKTLFIRALIVLLLFLLLMLFLTYGLKKYEDERRQVTITPTPYVTRYPTPTAPANYEVHYAMVVNASSGYIVVFDEKIGSERTIRDSGRIIKVRKFTYTDCAGTETIDCLGEGEIYGTGDISSLKRGDNVDLIINSRSEVSKILAGKTISNTTTPTFSNYEFGYASMNYNYIAFRRDNYSKAFLVDSKTQYLMDGASGNINSFKDGDICTVMVAENLITKLETR